MSTLRSRTSTVEGCRTLPELLEHRALHDARLTAFTYLGESRTWGELWAETLRFASYLRRQGLRVGDRVVLALANGVEFFPAFFGIQIAGCTAVPVFPDSGPDRLTDLVRLCEARGLVLPATGSPPALDSGALALTLAESSASPIETTLPRVGPENLAYIQYTSGSTGDPKGVLVSQANLLCNIRQLIEGMEIRRQDVFVSWLPVHHDMGLILMTLVPFYLGAALFLLPTDLRHPLAWAEAIERHRGTFTAAPDFAYRLLLRRLGKSPRVDLSSLRVAVNAAEPVRAQTMSEFESRCGPAVMMPAYGLAEATVAVTCRPPRSPAKLDARSNVAVGRPFPRIEIEIRGDSGPAPPGEVGEILVRSPANTRGYFGNAQATAELFDPRGWMRTGDLGYRDAEGDLFVVGRKKNIIIHAGRNLAPREIEEAVDALPFVRYSAAVGIDRGDDAGEQIYAFAEVRGAGVPDDEAYRRWSIAIVQAIHSRLGVRPARVVLLAPRSIPLTDSGKIRYPALRARYLDGSLRAARAILFPPF